MSKKAMQDFFDELMSDPKMDRLTTLFTTDILIYGISGEFKVKTVKGKLAYWYKGPFDYKFKRV